MNVTVSDQSAASIASAVLQDVDMVNKDDISKVVDRSKVRRERSKLRSKLTRCTHEIKPLGLSFDGRKDTTQVMIKKGRKLAKSTVIEEHITLVEEPQSKYIGHITVVNGSSKTIAEGIIQFFDTNKMSTEDIIAVGCDGTNVNTGVSGGVIRLLETRFGRPLQWLICMLHCNELPLRHLLQKLDGVTTGPKAFSGTIGKAIQTCEDLPVINYSPIEVEGLHYTNASDLSTDQQYLLNICRAVSSGSCSGDLALIKPGTVVYSRWMTTANRILKLYVASENPSENLVIISTFEMKVLFPTKD